MIDDFPPRLFAAHLLRSALYASVTVFMVLACVFMLDYYRQYAILTERRLLLETAVREHCPPDEAAKYLDLLGK